MRIAVVRGAFAAPAELQNFEPLAKKHQLTVFISKRNKYQAPAGIIVEKFYSPHDYVGKNRYLRGLFNRLFVDSHYLLGLEDKLKGFDVAICAETYYHYTQQCLTAKKQGYVKKAFSTVWENIPFNNESLRGRKEFKKRSFSEIDLFLAVTTQAKNALISEGCPSQKIIVLKPGIDLKMFKPKPRKSNKIKILVVSRSVPEKGIAQITELVNRLKRKYPQVELVMASGKVPYKDMPALYQNCDILLHYPIGSSTWQEQYGMALVEAMACGLPVVALDKGAVKEVVGNAGIIVSERTVEEALIKLIKDQKLRASFSRKSRAYTQRYYDANLFPAKIII